MKRKASDDIDAWLRIFRMRNNGNDKFWMRLRLEIIESCQRQAEAYAKAIDEAEDSVPHEWMRDHFMSVNMANYFRGMSARTMEVRMRTDPGNPLWADIMRVVYERKTENR